MAADFGKVLEKIKDDNQALHAAQANLGRALEKLDARLNVLKAGVRIEPYEVGKGGPVIGYRRFSSGWHITTHLEGIGGIFSEAPLTEAPSERQVELMPHVAGLLGKISDALAAKLKETTGATKEADRLLAAIREAS